MEIPMLSSQLIAALDKVYPLKNPSLDTPDRMLWRRAGQRDVVEMLLVSLQDQPATIKKK